MSERSKSREVNVILDIIQLSIIMRITVSIHALKLFSITELRQLDLYLYDVPVLCYLCFYFVWKQCIESMLGFSAVHKIIIFFFLLTDSAQPLRQILFKNLL